MTARRRHLRVARRRPGAGVRRRYDESGAVIGMVLVNVRWQVDRDGELTTTVPSGRINADEIAGALLPAT